MNSKVSTVAAVFRDFQGPLSTDSLKNTSFQQLEKQSYLAFVWLYLVLGVEKIVINGSISANNLRGQGGQGRMDDAVIMIS